MARRRLGWTCHGTSYCQIVKETNLVKRLDFCRHLRDTEEMFDDAIFTDECSVEMESHARLTFRRSDQPAKQKGRPKHPYKVHIWGGISKRGTTGLLIFTGIMDSDFYMKEILGGTLMPFIKDHFQQDNDPKHTSKATRKFITDNGINWWPTPPESPDLNPIEMLWHELKHHLRKRVKLRMAQELEDGINAFWTALTPERCIRYINHLQKVIPIVIEREG